MTATPLPTSSGASRWPSLPKVFGLAIALGASAVLGVAAWQHHVREHSLAAVGARPLDRFVQVSTQLRPAALEAVGQHYNLVVDLRPDGEVVDQPPSDSMRREATRQGLDFRYIPVPHGDIPESAVRELRQALVDAKGPTLLYCRSGKRAARTWALAEAGRPGGATVEAILAAVHGAGHDASDLTARLQAEVQQRGATQ